MKKEFLVAYQDHTGATYITETLENKVVLLENNGESNYIKVGDREVECILYRELGEEPTVVCYEYIDGKNSPITNYEIRVIKYAEVISKLAEK